MFLLNFHTRRSGVIFWECTLPIATLASVFEFDCTKFDNCIGDTPLGFLYFKVLLGLVFVFIGFFGFFKKREEPLRLLIFLVFFGLGVLTKVVYTIFLYASPEVQKEAFIFGLALIGGGACVTIAIMYLGIEELIEKIVVAFTTTLVVSTLGYFLGLEDSIELFSISLGVLAIAVSLSISIFE
jgi:hypothetical protein